MTKLDACINCQKESNIDDKPNLYNHHIFAYVPSCYKKDEVLQIHSFILDISIAPLQVHYYSEPLPTTALRLCRS